MYPLLAMIKYRYRLGALVIFLLSYGTAEAQFVNIRLEIPAGANFKSQVVDPMKGGSWENSRALTWIELTVPENITFKLEVNYPKRIIEPPLESYFLNNGTASFQQAIQLHNGEQQLRINNAGKLIRDMDPRPLSLSAWLGLPMTEGITVSIEYL